MADLNLAILRGRLGADPEVRKTSNGTSVANVSLATGSSYKNKQGEQVDKTEWHRLVLWGRKAEIAEEYLSKGDMISVQGELQTRKWESKEGDQRQTTEVNVFRLDMISTGNSSGGNSDYKASNKSDDGLELDDDFDDMDDDLPF
jgi:single-strand DNA-binding protein